MTVRPQREWRARATTSSRRAGPARGAAGRGVDGAVCLCVAGGRGGLGGVPGGVTGRGAVGASKVFGDASGASSKLRGGAAGASSKLRGGAAGSRADSSKPRRNDGPPGLR